MTAEASAAQGAVRLVAADVGHAYLSAQSGCDAALVTAAYAQLEVETDRQFSTLTHRESVSAIRIVFTRCAAPYRTDRELIAAVRATRVLEVTTAAVHAGRLHPVLGCEFGGPFDRFRAVHDFVGHARSGLGFGLADELAAWRVQHRLHGRLARRALATEILGVNSARSVLAEAPEQKAVLLDRDLITRSLHALAATEKPSQTQVWRSA